MKNLKIESTKVSPSIIALAKKGTVHIKGVSIPENGFEYYKKASDWIVKYLDSNSGIKFVLKFHYLNSSSLHYVKELIRNAVKLTDVEVLWYYETDDEDMLDVGESLSYATDIEFKMEKRDSIF